MPDNKHPYYIKIRPKFEEFVKAMKPYFDIHIYTHAVRRYAEQVVEAVDDPKNPIIKNIVCRDDFPDSKQKDLNVYFQLKIVWC
eukprot:UN31662